MSGFDWNAHEKVEPSKFNWDDHETVGRDGLVPDNSASIGKTALEHFGNGAALGYLPHMQAAVETAGNAVGDVKDKALDMVGLEHLASIDHQLRKQGFKLPDESYLAARDANIKRMEKEAKDNPVTAGASGVAGSVASGIAAAPLMGGQAATVPLRLMNAAKTGAAIGVAANPGDQEGQLAPVQLEDRSINGLKGAGTALAFQGGAEGISKAAPFISDNARKAGLWLKGKAENAAVNATGATGLQASKFSDDAGRQLLDRGLVRFGDTPKKISERVGSAMSNASADIDSSLKGLDAKGVTASADNVVSGLNEKIAELRKDPSQAGIVKKLQGIVDDIISTGESNVPIGQAEKTKRGFSKMAGNWMDPETGQAGKQAYLNYMDEVERAGNAADPSLASKFTEGKKTFGLLAPIEEAASKRANTLNQSPWGGLGDMAAVGSGGAAGGPLGAAAGIVGKKVLAPRVSSSVASVSDNISKFLLKSPQLSGLATRNPQAFNALAADFSRKTGNGISKVAGPNEMPVDDEQAKRSFVEGN